MLTTLTSDNYRDFHARYTGTYGWLVNDNMRKLIYIEKADGRAVQFSIGENMEHWAYADKGVMFDFIPVDHGLFNADDGKTYMLTRIPARQWKRGISQNNTQMKDIDTMQGVQLNYKSLSSIFNDNYGKLNYSSKADAGALSKHFAIRARDACVFFYDRAIGQINGGTITLNNNMVQQELTDLIRRTGRKMNVVVQ